MGPVRDELNVLIQEIRNSDMNKEQTLQILQETMNGIFGAYEGNSSTWGAGMVIGSKIKYVRSKDWKKKCYDSKNT